MLTVENLKGLNKRLAESFEFRVDLFIKTKYEEYKMDIDLKEIAVSDYLTLQEFRKILKDTDDNEDFREVLCNEIRKKINLKEKGE